MASPNLIGPVRSALAVGLAAGWLTTRFTRLNGPAYAADVRGVTLIAGISLALAIASAFLPFRWLKTTTSARGTFLFLGWSLFFYFFSLCLSQLSALFAIYEGFGDPIAGRTLALFMAAIVGGLVGLFAYSYRSYRKRIAGTEPSN